MTYTPRRIRQHTTRRPPAAVLEVNRPLTSVQAAEIKSRWLQAQRGGVAILGPDVRLAQVEPPPMMIDGELLEARRCGPEWLLAALLLLTLAAVTAVVVDWVTP